MNFEVSKNYDFYSVEIITGEGDDSNYLFKGFSDGKIQAFQYDGYAFTIPTELDPKNLKHEHFFIKHYYKANEFNYRNLTELSIENCYHKLKAITGNAFRSYAQYKFNKQALIMKDRLEILGVVLTEFFAGDASHGISSISVMNTIYTSKWLYHPESANFHNRIRFYLNSLVASGDLKSRWPGQLSCSA